MRVLVSGASDPHHAFVFTSLRDCTSTREPTGSPTKTVLLLIAKIAAKPFNLPPLPLGKSQKPQYASGSTTFRRGNRKSVGAHMSPVREDSRRVVLGR